ncbi:MAG: transcriptional repressor [Eubacteriales bacterium]|nr:transcriptional repressor [Eubacteriales bacterium]
MKLKYSKQREAIKEYLRSTHEHPTADTVYENIKLVFPKISLGTVYRNLALLTELGEIKKIAGVSGPDRFDAEARPHHHFTCTECGRITDIFAEPEKEALLDNVLQDFPGTVTNREINFYGICPYCEANIEPPEDK